MTKHIPLLALALISSAAVADAADEKDKPMRGTAATFEALDKDSDQRLSQSEAAADPKVSARFASLDADGDGSLTKREFMARAKPETTTPEPYR